MDQGAQIMTTEQTGAPVAEDPDHPKYRGLAVPVTVAGAEDLDPYAMGWKDGVDAHYRRTLDLARERQLSGRDLSVLKLSGWSRDAVRAFGYLTQEDADTARQIVRRMSGPDRAVLSFYLQELSDIVSHEEMLRQSSARTRAREAYEKERDTF
jgi:hypothetical protein